MSVNLIEEIQRERERIVRIERKRKHIGCDGFNFELAIGGANRDVYLEKAPLKNRHGQKYGDVEVDKGKININISLPKYIRDDNTKPFDLVDISFLESLLNDFEQALAATLQGIVDEDTDLLSATAKSIECNITIPVSGKSTCSQVLDLLNRSFTETTNTVYQSASKKCKYDKENETVIIPKKNYYKLKCYNKTLEQLRLGNFVGENLLRIEVVMLNRTIVKLFGNDCTARKILKKQGLKQIIAEYKRIFREDVIDGHVKPCLSDVKDILFESLEETNSQTETIALYKQLVVDERVFRKALEKWYLSNGNNLKQAKQNAATYICRNKNKYGFPENVVDTLRKFGSMCK